MKRLACLGIAAAAALCAPRGLVAAETNFYSFNDRWEKTNSSGRPKSAAVEDGFKKALSAGASSALAVPEPPALRKTLAEIIRDARTIQIELGQSLFVSGDGRITKFVSTDEGIVLAESADPNLLRLKGTTIGRTFMHLWDASGRKTFEIQVTPPTIVPSQLQQRQLDEIEKTRSFKFGYSNTRSAFYTGDKAQEVNQTSHDFNQNLTMEGDTPYGTLVSNIETQRTDAKMIFTDVHVGLQDGQVGEFRDFDLGLGDNRVRPELMVFPAGRIRGAALDHGREEHRTRLSSFYGREQSSVVGTLTPGAVTKRTQDSFLSGNTVDFKLNDEARLKAGVFTGHGQSRTDELNRAGYGAKADVRLGEYVVFSPETDFDDEHTAQKYGFLTTFEKLQIRTEFRDISNEFQTLIGAPSRQGEVGAMVDWTAAPFETLSLSGTLDRFRDRLIPNPDVPEAFNTHWDFMARWVPRERMSVLLTHQFLDDTGRLGPTKQHTFGLQVNQQFELFSHRATAFARYQNRDSRVITNSLSDYSLNKFVLGMQTEIFWGIDFSMSQEWSILDERNLDLVTHPRLTVYSLEYSERLGATPFFLEARLRIEDEEEAESQNSFLRGEDSVEVSGGIYYREYDNLELFATGSFENFDQESTTITAPRVEAQFLTGMRYSFDTGFRWAPVGNFQGYVFKDLNGDGIRQPEEPGLPGIGVRAGGKEAMSDEEGFYLLGAISGKRTLVTLDSSKIPYGYAPTTDIEQDLEILQAVTQEADFGLMPRSEIYGIVFNDLNGDGRYDLSDLGVRKVKIVLEDGTAARTNQLGVYSFPGAAAGEHTASLDLKTLPEGYLPSSSPKKTFTVHEGIRFELYFPLRATRLVSGRVFEDADGNGLLDAGEKGIPGARVRLGDLEVLTDAEGWYLFDQVNAGRWTLDVDPRSVPADLMTDRKETLELGTEPASLREMNLPARRSRQGRSSL